jgi:cation:H+ antiporter
VTTALVLLTGILAAAIGGELFVRGAVGMAAWLRIPAGVIGATVAAFATSAPELAVGINAAAEGTPEIALGDALGSNVVNIGLVLGVAVTLAGIRPDPADLRRDVPVALAAPVLTGILALGGVISRWDGAALLALFAAWLVLAARQALRTRSAATAVLGERRRGLVALSVTAGLALLIVAGRLIVVAAEEIGDGLGLDPFVVGLTFVALGTSAPELATTVVSRIRGHDEVGMGTILGSNIYNNLWIVGLVAVVRPIPVQGAETAVALCAGFALVLMTLPGRSGMLRRGRGVLLLAGYLAALVATLAAGSPA